MDSQRQGGGDLGDYDRIEPLNDIPQQRAETMPLSPESSGSPFLGVQTDKPGFVSSFRPVMLQHAGSTKYSSFNDSVLDSPQETQARRDRRWKSFWGILALDVLQILMVLPFVVLGVLVLVMDGKLTEEISWLPEIITASTYGPTVFPILFALVVGRLMKAVAYYKLERRTTVQTMEQLKGSRTVVTAFVTQFKMSGYNLLGLVIVLTWALSPIGSQASLRVASIVGAKQSWPFNHTYLETRQRYSPGDYGISVALSASLFTSSIMMPNRTRSDPQDPWGNVRVPLIEELERQEGIAEPSADKTFVMEGREGSVPYASLVGIPMTVNSSLPEGTSADLTFNFKTSYWWLDCSTEVTLGNGSDTNFFPLTVANYSVPGTKTRVATEQLYRALMAVEPTDIPLNATMQEKLKSQLRIFPWTPRQFFLLTHSKPEGEQEKRFTAVCNLTTTFVHVEAECSGTTSRAGKFTPSKSTGTLAPGLSGSDSSSTSNSSSESAAAEDIGGCRAKSVRRSLVNSTLSTMSLFDVLGVGRDTTFLQNFMGATTLGYTTRLTPAFLPPNIGYLADPDNPFGFEVQYPDWTQVSARDFGMRFAQLLNTYWLTAVGYKPVQGDFSEVPAHLGLLPGEEELYGQGLAFSPTSRLDCDRGWTAALLLASGLLLIAAVCTLPLNLWRRVPDILDHFSTLIKDNPYARIPEGYRNDSGLEVNFNSMEDGFERARKIREMEVQIGDIAPSAEHGYIAIGTPDTVAIQRLGAHRRFV